MNRRIFLKNTGHFGIALAVLGASSCMDKKSKKTDESQTLKDTNITPFFKLSLAQWSINKAIREDGLDPFLFAEKAASLGFEGIEYVSQLYNNFLKEQASVEEGMKTLVARLKEEASKNKVKNLLIMIDTEGDLASDDLSERDLAVENHKKWVDAAAELGCHSVRVNLFGSADQETWKNASVDGLSKLCAYAAPRNINVLVENHGQLSSNAAMVVEVMRTVNLPNCGTLPDFGNFCLRREGGALWDTKCLEEYDKYQGVEELLPYAKAVSAKAFDFDENGNETTIDFLKMMQLVKDSGYDQYIGIEYEGSRLGEEEGIIATKNLLLKTAQLLN